MKHMSQTPPPPPNAYAAAPSPMSPSEEKTWAILTHIGGIFFSFLAPLIIFLVMKDRGPFIRAHAATALNFHLTLLIAYFIGVVASIIVIGLFVMLAAWVVSIIFGIMAAVAANNGQYYQYPLAIKFLS